MRWALFDCRRERRAYFSLSNFSLVKEADLRRTDIPISYGQPEKFFYGKGVGLSLSPFNEVSMFQNVIERCHNVIRDNENLSPLAAFPVISRIIYTKIYDELNTPEGEYYGFQIGESEEPVSVASRIANIYRKASSREPEIFSPTLGIEKPETLFQIVEILQRFTLFNSPFDVKGEAYQAYLSAKMRDDAGQYFTPREVVKPTVEILSPKDDERIIDPCCGTGGFLIYAYRFVRDFIRTHYREEVARKLYDVARNNIFGIEVDPNVAEACIAGMLLEDDSHGNIAVVDALSSWDNPIFIRKGIGRGKFQIVVTNPPFGKKGRLKSHKSFTLGKQFKTPPFEALILERSLELLAPGGRAGFVIPDIDLTRREILEFLWRETIILGVVSLPSETFNPYGSGAKTSVIFFRKKVREDEETTRILMASVSQIGYDSTGRRKGRNAYEDVVKYFRKFLEGEKIEPIINDRFAVFTLEGDELEKARENLRENLKVESHLPRGKGGVPLGEVADVLRGFTPGWYEYKESGVPILKVRNLKNRFLDFTFERRGFVPREIYERHPEAQIRLYDIVLTASAHRPEYIAKKVDIVDVLPFKECMASAELLIIRAKKINPFYLLSVLRMEEVNEQFRSCIRGTTAHIYPSDVARKVLIPRLEPEEEEKIGESLRKSLEIFRQFEAEYDKYIKLLKGFFR
ncbi:MAG: N-6 DNA methylase [Candidatus Korarchaeum sp.]